MVYKIEDRALYNASISPLKYRHNGLSAVTVSRGDQIMYSNYLEERLLCLEGNRSRIREKADGSSEQT